MNMSCHSWKQDQKIHKIWLQCFALKFLVKLKSDSQKWIRNEKNYRGEKSGPEENMLLMFKKILRDSKTIVRKLNKKLFAYHSAIRRAK